MLANYMHFPHRPSDLEGKGFGEQDLHSPFTRGPLQPWLPHSAYKDLQYHVSSLSSGQSQRSVGVCFSPRPRFYRDFPRV
jgi:hypothetical protein